MKNYQQLILRYFNLNRRRTILTLCGIILSVALMTSIGLFIISLQANMIETTKQTQGAFHVMYRQADEQLQKLVANNPKVSKVELLQGPKQATLKDENMQVFEISNDEEPRLLPIRVEKGSLPSTENEIALERWFIWKLDEGINIGDTITLTFNEGVTLDYVLTGFLENIGGTQLANETLAIATNSSKNMDMASLFVEINEKTNLQEAVLELQALTDEDNFSENKDLLRLLGGSTSDSFNEAVIKLAIFVITIIVIATIAVIYNSFHISVVQRVQHFGLLQAIGMTKKQLRGLVMREAVYISLISIPLGLLFGLLAFWVIVFTFNQMSQDALFSNLQMVIRADVFIYSSILGLISIFVSAYLPARTAMKISPLTAISQRHYMTKERINRKNSLIVKKIFGLNSLLAFKNMRRNRKRFYITTFSMVLSVALFIVFSSILKISGVFISDVGEAEKTDIVIHNQSSQDLLTEQFKEEIQNIDGVESVYREFSARSFRVFVTDDMVNEKVKEYWHYDFTESGLFENHKPLRVIDSDVYVIEDDELEELLKSSLISGSLDASQMNEKHGVILIANNQFYDAENERTVVTSILNTKVGEKLYIDPSFTHQEDYLENLMPIEISAIVDQNPFQQTFGQLTFIITRSFADELVNIQAKWTDEKWISTINHVERLSVKLKDPSYEESVSEQIEQFIGQDSLKYLVENRMDEVRSKRAMFVQVNTLVYGFVIVITIISMINIANTVTTNLLLRKKEFALLQAVGMTSQGIRRMIATEGIIYGLFGAVFGSIFGVICTTILYMILSGIRGFDFIIYYDLLIIGSIAAIILGLVSALLPLRKLKHANIIEDLREVE